MQKPLLTKACALVSWLAQSQHDYPARAAAAEVTGSELVAQGQVKARERGEIVAVVIAVIAFEQPTIGFRRTDSGFVAAF